MKLSRSVLLAVAASAFSADLALAQDTRGVPAVSAIAATRTAMPVVTSLPLNYTRACSGGGTRTTAGSWDIVAGNLDVLTTYAGCVVSHSGEKQDGTSKVHGTLLVAGGVSGLNINLTFTDNLAVTRGEGSKVTLNCNRTRSGSFDQATSTFHGTSTTTACSTTGTVRDLEGIAEHLLREYAVLAGTALPLPNFLGR